MRLKIFLIVIAASLMATPAANTESSKTGSRAVAEAAFNAYAALFSEENSGLPKNVRVLGVRADGGFLTLNLSSEVLNYGGNAYEREFIAILLNVAEDIPGITHFTLLIDGLERPLTEGREVEMIPILPREAS